MFNNYTFSNLSHSFIFSSPKSLLTSTLISLFIFHFIFLYFVSSSFLSSFPLLPFHLPTTLNFNITIHLSLHLPLFCLFIFTSSYYKFVIRSSIICIVFPHKKVLSLSLSQYFLEYYYFSCISTLS